MIDVVITKVVNSLTDPASIVLFFWVICLLRQNGKLHEINDRLLEAQSERGITMAKMTLLLDKIFDAIPELKNGKGGASI